VSLSFRDKNILKKPFDINYMYTDLRKLMKRINLYVPEIQDNTIGNLSKILNKSKAELTRLAVDDYLKKYEAELHNFENNKPVNSNEDIIKKCGESPIFFIDNYVHINTRDSGMQLFKMWDFQKEMVEDIHSNRKVIANKARQIGFTCTVCAYIVHYVLFNRGKNVIVMSHKLNAAQEILRNIEAMLQNLPNFLKPKSVEYSKRTIEINGNRIFALAAANEPIRGYVVDLIFIDEAAYIKKEELDALMYSLAPALRDTGKLITGSSSGPSIAFLKMWVDAMGNYNDFKPIRISYEAVPGRDENWAKKEIEMIGKENFEQEYECRWKGIFNICHLME
jgi:hypothetical protein